MFNWRKNLRVLGGRCSIVLFLVLAGCASNDDSQVLSDPAPADQGSADQAGPETDANSLTVDGEETSAGASQPTESASTLVIGGGDAETESTPAPTTAGKSDSSTSASDESNSNNSTSSSATATNKPTNDEPSGSAADSTPTDPTVTATTAALSTEAPSTEASSTETSASKPPVTRPVETTAAPVNRPGAFINVNFQGTPTGTYDDARIKADWGGGAVRYTKTDGRAVISEEGGNRFVRIRFPNGKFGTKEAGSQWAVNLGSNSSDEMFISYRVRFVGDFDFVLGGKLPGLSGGASNTGGSKPNGNDGWSSRIMWRRQGGAVQYVYHPDQPSTYGEDFNWNQTFPTNRWVTVETRVKMNTPGDRNGVVQTWMDGRQVLNRTDVRFRDTSAFGIDRFLFDTFFGGNSSEWAPSKEEHIDFDDFVVSGSPITH